MKEKLLGELLLHHEARGGVGGHRSRVRLIVPTGSFVVSRSLYTAVPVLPLVAFPVTRTPFDF